MTDDGVGFDADAARAGYGIAGMRDRLAAVGGRLEVSSSSDGTEVSARVPAGREDR